MWERLDDDEVEPEVIEWEVVDDDLDVGSNRAGVNSTASDIALHGMSPLSTAIKNREMGSPGRPLSLHSKEGRAARAALQTLSIRELRERLVAIGAPADGPAERGILATRLLEVQGVEAVLSSLHMQNGIGSKTAAQLEPSAAPDSVVAEAEQGANSSACPDVFGKEMHKIGGQGLDYSRFNRIDYAKDYGLGSDDDPERECTKAKLPDLRGTPLEGLDPVRFLAGNLTDEERRDAFLKAMKEIAEKGGLKAPPAPPAPDCNPMAGCTPSCDFELGPQSWLEPEVAWSGQWPDTAEVALANEDFVEEEGNEVCAGTEYPQEDNPDVAIEDDPSTVARRRVADKYGEERQKIDDHARVLEAVDVDGWSLEKSQLDLVEEADEDLTELRILLECCEREDNRVRLLKAISEFEMKLRVKRTWAWFPLTRWEWTGYEFEKPVVIVDFKVPGASKLPADDIHCDFGVDWFDLKVWNVIWPEEPGVPYHHRVKKTRLMRDIIPSQSFVKVDGDHVCIHLQKVYDARHGYCAWPDLCAGKGRKPFKYNEEAPDGGLMDFFEGEYEKHEGYDGFRRDIGKAMEKIHRGEPIRGIDDSPIEEP